MPPTDKPSKHAEDDAPPAAPDRHYKVVKGQAGPFPQGHVFTAAEFARLHPVPKDPAAAQIDPGTYHADLLGRLKVLGVVADAAVGEEAADTPVGPEGRPPQAVGGNPSIAAAVQEELRQQQQRDAVAAESARQASEARGTAPVTPTGTTRETVPAAGTGTRPETPPAKAPPAPGQPPAKKQGHQA